MAVDILCQMCFIMRGGTGPSVQPCHGVVATSHVPQNIPDNFTLCMAVEQRTFAILLLVRRRSPSPPLAGRRGPPVCSTHLPRFCQRGRYIHLLVMMARPMLEPVLETMAWSKLAFLALTLITGAVAESRTSPPAGAISVRQGVATSSTVFNTISSAIASLPNDSSNRTIFIYPGTYSEQVYITRSGPLTIYGSTTDTSNFAKNQVVIQAGVPASTAGSDDASGTLRVHKDNFRLYNVNVTNTYGIGSQAIAISQYGSRVGIYACSFIGYQDTLYANKGTQVYLKSYIEGAVDFIFGRTGFAYFGGNTIGVKAAGCITANGRTSNDGGSYVFNSNKIILAPNAASSASGKVYLGRPWGNFSKVIFKNTVVTAPLNQALWSVWNSGDERTNNVFFADYNTSGSGASNLKRASFSTVLSQSQANSYSISSAVGSDYATWVDPNFLV